MPSLRARVQIPGQIPQKPLGFLDKRVKTTLKPGKKTMENQHKPTPNPSTR